MLPCCQDFILEHYSEDGSSYEDEIADLMDLRQVRCSSDLSEWNTETELRGLYGPPSSLVRVILQTVFNSSLFSFLVFVGLQNPE